VVEKDVGSLGNTLLVRYENIVTEAEEVFESLYQFIGMEYHVRQIKYIRQTSIEKESYHDITPVVRDLCDSLSRELQNLTRKGEHWTDNAKCFRKDLGE